MLPPVDPVVLQRNPNFEVLYKDLCSRKLNPDGSTRDTKKQRIHDEIRKSLSTSRAAFLSSQLLINTLSDLPSKAANLPPELHSVIEIVIAQLRGHVSSSDREILSADISLFLDSISTISSALSIQLSTIATLLSTIAAEPLHRNTPTLSPSSLSHNAASIQDAATHHLPQNLAEARMDLANTASTLLSTHLSLLTLSISILEQTQHGSLSRHTRSSAEYLHARATVLDLQAKLHTINHAPPNQFLAALKVFKRGQGSGERALKDREGIARRELDVYEKAGGKGLRDLAGRKRALEREIERVEVEVGKLEGSDRA
ncbi:Nn.00g091550.m01.CDS01 [Neocucurbitaria sp. VM-36]